MHLMRGGKLRDRLLAAKQLLNDLGFEGGAVTLSHGADPPYRCPDFCLVSWVHHTRIANRR